MKSIRIILLMIIFFTITTIPFVPLAAAVTWSTETPLTTLRYFDGLPFIIQTQDNKIWIAWEIVIGSTADIAYSVYDGLSWTDIDLLTTHPSNDIGPSIFQATNGTIWLFWSSDRNGNYDIFYKASSDNGLSWSNEFKLTTSTFDDTGVSATQTKDGKIWVVWQRKFSTSSSDLFYKTYDGSSWSGESQLTTDPKLDEIPSITQMVDGKIWVAWCSYRTGDYEIYYKTSSNGGLSWSNEDRLTTSANSDIDPAIIQARDNTIWIVWISTEPTQNAADNLFYVTSSDKGDTWSSWVPLTSSNNYDNMWPSIAQMRDKTLWVAFTSNRNENFDIYYKISSQIFFNDVAITSVVPDSTIVNKGQTVSINVMAENQGDFSETFTVNCYAGSNLIGSQTITLSPQGSTKLTFPWDTSTYSVGFYTVSANASVVLGETPINMGDNTFIGGTVQVVTRDVAVTNVYASASSVAQGYILKIYVQVKNEGTITESFAVTAYNDSIAIATQTVIDLAPNTYRTLTFNWNTTGVPYGNHVVSATAAAVPGETDTADNSVTDGTVKVKIPGDVDGNGNVNLNDLMLIVKAFGTDPRYPQGTDWNIWNPDCDINNDARVDVFDLYITAKNYGKTVG